jgi:hypothetical protein
LATFGEFRPTLASKKRSSYFYVCPNPSKMVRKGWEREEKAEKTRQRLLIKPA